MSATLKLKANGQRKIRTYNPRLVSYNIEMTEVTGGTFWKAYTDAQIAGTEQFPKIDSFTNHTALAGLMQYYPPIDLYNEKLRALAAELGPVWVRVSGTWATKTYYDFDGSTGGNAPAGYQSVLTRDQWIGVLDFVKFVGAKLLVSVSNCQGDHDGTGPISLEQTKKLFDLSHEWGVDIDAIEFMNEPNMLVVSGAPLGYTGEDFVRDQDIVNSWVKEHYPNCLIVGPCTTGGAVGDSDDSDKVGAGIGSMLGKILTTDDLMRGSRVPLDVFSYHYYNGISERLASVMPAGHWDASLAHTDRYLAVAADNCRMNIPGRDKHAPGAEMWVTESGDAGGGGDTWASTYLDVLRTLNELGSFVTLTDGVIFHNTLASSDYGFLRHSSFDPRPNYFAVLLWNRLMGNTAYDAEHPHLDGAHVYCHSRADGKEGVTYLVINNDRPDALTVELPRSATVHLISGNGDLRSRTMYLGNRPLVLGENNSLPDLTGESVPAGLYDIPVGACAFITL